MIIITGHVAALAQNAASNIGTLFQSRAIKNIQEKIYVHLNRPDLLTGEILWFKIYCVDGMQHRPMDLSQIAYAEIIDQNNKPMVQTKIGLVNGMGSGSFYIPATLTTGTYLFRAYTNWMKNNAPEFFYQQSITIVNTLKATDNQSQRPLLSALDIQFFPEGGQLVQHLTSRVGFQVLNEKGKGVDGTGAVLNQLNDTIVTFKTLKFGIGSFLFTPKPNMVYHALFSGSKPLVAAKDILTSEKSGYAMMVQDTLTDKIKVTVTGSDPVIAIQLFVHTRQSIKVMETASSNKRSIEFLVDRNKLGDGISHFTIFDIHNNPLCERLYFKKPMQVLNIQAQADQKEYSIRRKVSLNIQSSQNLSGNLSVSVFRADSISSTSSMVSALYLTSDLKGQVESPAYYFSDNLLSTLAADNLMLTQGWRRFHWPTILSVKTLPITHLPELKGHLVQGRIVDENGSPSVGKIGYFASPGKKIRVYLAKSDTAGRVHFQMKNFQETGKIIAQTNYEIDSLSHIEIESPFSSTYSPWQFNQFILPNSAEEGLLDRSVAMQVQDVFYEDETYFRYRQVTADSVPFYGKADEVYNLDDYTRFPVMEEVLREYIKGVWVRKKKDQFRFMVIDKERNDVFKQNPLTLLDGVPIFDINQVLEIDPLKIKKLEVVTRKYFLGPRVLHGIVSFSSYNGDLGGVQLDPRSITLDYEGLQRQREFYSPKYSFTAARASRLPDQRLQLYWNPNVTLRAGQATDLEFYTSDVEGQFIIMIEGLVDSGMPVHEVTMFKVSR